jgi:hypothetical protein
MKDVLKMRNVSLKISICQKLDNKRPAPKKELANLSIWGIG